MEFKIPPNLVIVLIVVIGLIVLINLNVISFFGTGKKDKDIAVQEYVTNKKIDSLIQVIQENQESIGKYNEKIEEYQKSIEGIDKKIAKNQKAFCCPPQPSRGFTKISGVHIGIPT